jgi:hypothetical protein
MGSMECRSSKFQNNMHDLDDFIEKMTRSSKDRFSRNDSATMWFCILPDNHGWNCIHDTFLPLQFRYERFLVYLIVLEIYALSLVPSSFGNTSKSF